jgi:glycosyltransferase involved in cell wall biosynthesis
MPFDLHPQDLPQATTATGATLLYVLPQGGPDPADTEGQVQAEMAGLAALGHRVVPFSLASREAEEAAPPVELVRRPFGLARAVRLAFTQTAMPARQALALGARVAEAARRHGCTLIHAAAADDGATAALVGARLAGVKASIAGRGREVYAEGRDLALKLGAADVAVAACREMAEEFKRLAPRARVRAVPAAVDADWFRPEPTAERNGRLLCIAALVPRSGLSVLIAALATLPADQRPVVDVIGAGPLLEQLRAEALERGVSDQLRFLGARGRRWIAQEGQQYLGLVEPGIVAPDGDRDPLPVAILQAMALELPVLATSLMAVREVVQPDCGHLVPPGEVVALARGLRWLAIMPESLRRRLGRAGRDRVLTEHTVEQRSTRLDRALAA